MTLKLLSQVLIANIISILYVSLGWGQIVNVESQRFSGDKQGLQGSFGASLTIVYNKTHIFNLNGNSHIQYNFTKQNQLLFITNISYLRTDNNNSLNNGLLHLRYTTTLFKQFGTDMFIQWQYDLSKNIADRRLIGANLRYANTISPFFYHAIGSGFFFEREKDNTIKNILNNVRSSSYISLRIGNPKDISFKQIAYIQPELKTFEDVRMNLGNELNIQLSRIIALNIIFNLYYDSHPSMDIQKTTYEWRNGITVSF